MIGEPCENCALPVYWEGGRFVEHVRTSPPVMLILAHTPERCRQAVRSPGVIDAPVELLEVRLGFDPAVDAS